MGKSEENKGEGKGRSSTPSKNSGYTTLVRSNRRACFNSCSRGRRPWTFQSFLSNVDKRHYFPAAIQRRCERREQQLIRKKHQCYETVCQRQLSRSGRSWVSGSSEPAVFEDSAHDPAVLGATPAQFEHAVVDVVPEPLVMSISSQVQLARLQYAQVTPGHRQRLLQPVSSLTTHTYVHARRSLSTVGGTHSGQSTPPLLSSSHSPSFSPPERCKVSQQVWNRVPAVPDQM